MTNIKSFAYISLFGFATILSCLVWLHKLELLNLKQEKKMPLKETIFNIEARTEGGLPVCDVHIVAYHPKVSTRKISKRKDMWVSMAEGRCGAGHVQCIREKDQAYVDHLTERQRSTLTILRHWKVIQQDYQKLLVAYYNGGLAVDYDVIAKKSYPAGWFNAEDETNDCSLILGVEGDKELSKFAIASALPKSILLGKVLNEIENVIISTEPIRSSGGNVKLRKELVGLKLADVVQTSGGLDKLVSQDGKGFVKVESNGEKVCLYSKENFQKLATRSKE